MTTDIPQLLTFDSFGLDSAILDAVNKLGYESPTPSDKRRLAQVKRLLLLCRYCQI